MRKKTKKILLGFTLIEMMVVVLVVGIGLIGALSFFSINLNNQFEAKQELIATGLAQEGAELVSNIRDYNLLNGKVWDFNLGNMGTSCTAIDYNSLSSHICSNVGAAVCLDANGRYYQCANGDTIFTRTILVSAPNTDTSRTITCTVSWNGRTTQSVTYLYNNAF
jgi:prepilin-type N-terminal cleavage/methylation domain-containing protein